MEGRMTTNLLKNDVKEMSNIPLRNSDPDADRYFTKYSLVIAVKILSVE
jgi:hypothetical protein